MEPAPSWRPCAPYAPPIALPTYMMAVALEQMLRS